MTIINSKITFVSSTTGLTEVDECLPQPSLKFTPEWWKLAKPKPSSISSDSFFEGNIKMCPSFPDFFSSGYIVPMWADVILSHISGTDQWAFRTTHEDFSFKGEALSQTLDVMPFSFEGSKGKFVFKAISPWKIITDPGYSCLILPLYFHFNEDFSIIPGVVDTDIHHSIHPDIVFHTKNTDLFIERGTPLFQVVPFKRVDTNLEVKEVQQLSQEEFKKYGGNLADIRTKFIGGKRYIKKRKSGGFINE